ncbi:MAG TPA: hypothetical protein VF457_13565, partial [Burkholderiaceae bacterium]
DLADHGHGDHSSNPAAQKSSKGRLNTRVKFRSAEPSEVGQFSVGANIAAFIQRDRRSIFHFHRSLLGGDGWGKFDDHEWGLLEDH